MAIFHYPSYLKIKFRRSKDVEFSDGILTSQTISAPPHHTIKIAILPASPVGSDAFLGPETFTEFKYLENISAITHLVFLR